VSLLKEVAAALVDGDGVSSVGHVGIARGIRQLQGIPDPTDGADRVPYADHVKGAWPTEGGFEALSYMEGVNHAVGLTGSPGVHLHDIGDETIITGAEKAEHPQDAGNGTCCIGSSAKAEEVDVVALFVDVHQVTVGVGDVTQKARSEGQARNDGECRSQLVGRVGRAFGANARMIVANLSLLVDEEGLVELDDVGVVVAVGIVGAITADDDVLRHKKISLVCRWDESY